MYVFEKGMGEPVKCNLRCIDEMKLHIYMHRETYQIRHDLGKKYCITIDKMPGCTVPNTYTNTYMGI